MLIYFMAVLHFLILFFGLLISYQTFLVLYSKYSNANLIEGLENATNTVPNVTAPVQQTEYKPYNLSDPNNSLILAQQNAGNIEVLKGRIDGLDGVKFKVDDMQQSINLMQTQIDGLVQQQTDYAQEIAGSTPATITGTSMEEEGEEEKGEKDDGLGL
jgi:hypothetical protein